MIAGSASRALAALEIVSVRPMSAPGLAVALGVHVRTARRLLEELTAGGWLESYSSAPRLYRATLRPIASAWRILAARGILPRIEPFARRLARRGLVTEVALPCFDSVLAIRPLAAEDGLGARLLPAHTSAAGKALLATRPRWLESMLAGGAVIEAGECARIVAHGIAVERDAWRPGRTAVAVPIPAGARDPEMSISISGRTGRLSDGALAALAVRAQDLAERLASAHAAEPRRSISSIRANSSSAPAAESPASSSRASGIEPSS